MNKYEKLFDDILNKTKLGVLEWRQLRKDANSDVIFNVNVVWRQYSTTIERNTHSFTILLVEKKYDDPEFDLAYEKYRSELLVLDEGELVTTLDDSTVSATDIAKLISVVETKSDKAKRLFS